MMSTIAMLSRFISVNSDLRGLRVVVVVGLFWRGSP
jgi:hypothetical protein